MKKAYYIFVLAWFVIVALLGLRHYGVLDIPWVNTILDLVLDLCGGSDISKVL